MVPVIRLLLQVLYVATAAGLAVVGFNTLLLSVLYLIHRRPDSPAPAPLAEEEWPHVLVQLPVYNERFVVERVIRAALSLDYPRNRLEIQVLDDSTDDTVATASQAVARGCEAGFDISIIRRTDRVGFKAGALAAGLQRSTAPFVAIFDADFMPPADFLRRIIPYFAADERLGMVQTRWAHINDSQNPLTRAQALALDAHFVVEQAARQRSGLRMNFSGTAGVWRQSCIADAGGWAYDTLSEDIDLSYRAQLRNWRFLYLPDLAVPAEIPPLMMGFKRQQMRWAVGTVQCLRKLGPSVLSSGLTVVQKAQGLIHLGGYLLHPLMLFLLVLTLPLLLLDGIGGLPLAGLGLAMLGSPLQVVIAQRYLYPDWVQRMLFYPVFMLMGAGIAASNTYAVWLALSGRSPSFRRTPKFGIERRGRGWPVGSYVLKVDWTTWLEVILAVYAAITAGLAVTHLPALVPFMVLYAGGFASTAGLSLWQTRQLGGRRHQQRRALGLFSSSR